MWISKKEYEGLKASAERLKDVEQEFLNAIEIYHEKSKIDTEIYSNTLEELYETKKELKYYLDTNEEKGVVYIPKFIVEKIVYDR